MKNVKNNYLYNPKILFVRLLAIIIAVFILYLLINNFWISLHTHIVPDAFFVKKLSFSSDGSLLTAASYQDIFLWNVENKRLIYDFPIGDNHNKPYGSDANVAISSKKRFVVTYDNRVFNLYSLVNMRKIFEVHNDVFNSDVGQVDTALEFSPNEEYCLNVDGIVIDNNNKLVHRLEKSKASDIFTEFYALHKTVNGKWIVKTDYFRDENRMEIILTDHFVDKLNYNSSAAQKWEIEIKEDESYDIYVGGSKLFIVVKHSNEIVIIDFEYKRKKRVRFKEKFLYFVYHFSKVIGFSYNGEWIVTDNKLAGDSYDEALTTDKSIYIYDTDTLKCPYKIPFQDEYPNVLIAVEPQNKLVALCQQDLVLEGVLKLIEIETGKTTVLRRDQLDIGDENNR